MPIFGAESGTPLGRTIYFEKEISVSKKEINFQKRSRITGSLSLENFFFKIEKEILWFDCDIKTPRQRSFLKDVANKRQPKRNFANEAPNK